jgi:hypothetical protein
MTRHEAGPDRHDTDHVYRNPTIVSGTHVRDDQTGTLLVRDVMFQERVCRTEVGNEGKFRYLIYCTSRNNIV